MKISGSKRKGQHLKKKSNAVFEEDLSEQDGFDVGEVLAFKEGFVADEAFGIDEYFAFDEANEIKDNFGSDETFYTNEDKDTVGSEPISERPERSIGISVEKPKNTKKKVLIVLSAVFGVLIVAGLSMYFYVQTALGTRPPIRSDPWGTELFYPDDPNNPFVSVQTPKVPGATVFTRDTETLKYTFLLMATDEDGSNTDVIMVASFDTTNNKMEIVNIPRDTLANVSWNLNKKVNSVYANMRARHGWGESSLPDAMDATVETLADILGFKVDYWFLVDMRAFVELINAIDGVEFYIPVNMYYHDPYGNNGAGFTINYSRGTRLLYGKEALEVMRFRSFANADIGRIGTQQDFLMTAMQQILAKRDSINVIELANIVLRYVKTDADLSSLIWFGREFLRLDSEGINFHILPGNYWDGVGGTSYVSVYVDQWLELINGHFNPFNEDILPIDVSILTRGTDGYLYVTDGNRQGDASWGSGRGTPYAGAGTAPANPGGSSNQVNNTPPNNQPLPSNNPQQSTPPSNGEPSDPGDNPGMNTGENPEDDPDIVDPGDDPDIDPFDPDNPQDLDPIDPDDPEYPDDPEDPEEPGDLDDPPDYDPFSPNYPGEPPDNDTTDPGDPDDED